MSAPAETLRAIGAAAPDGLPARCLIALALVESGGRVAWLVDGEDRPPIAPEPHVFHRLLSGEARDRAVALGLAHPRWGGIAVPSSYRGRYAFLERMRAVDREAADGATSWGWGQVMGHHGPALGYGSASALAEACETAAGQSDAVVRYLGAHGLTPYLAALPDRAAAERFAAAYNGPGHARHDYAGRLIHAWKRSGEGREGQPGRDVRALQAALARLGHYPDRVDGLMGPRTQAAVRAFQEASGIVADGIAGPMTWAEIDAALAQAREDKRQRRARKVAATGSAAAVATPALAEIVREADSIAVTAQSLLTSVGLAGPLLALAVAGVVGLVVWRALR